MRTEPAGDFDYDALAIDYSSIRRPEPRFLVAIEAALGDARTLINVGAGAGSYEPDHLVVTPVEPSASMRAQRPVDRAVAIDAVAEDLPFPDQAFDAALASFTVHQWKDLERGLAELRRVTRGPIVVLTFDPEELQRFWLADYASEVTAAESRRMPTMAALVEGLGVSTTIETVAIPAGCTDGIVEAYFGRPEAFLDERVRRAQSSWGFVDEQVQASAVERLRSALDDGSWDERFGYLRTATEYDGSLRLVVSSDR